MTTEQSEIIRLAASRVAYWDPRVDDWSWRGARINPNWDNPAAEWDAIVLAAGKQRALLVADDDDAEYEQMLVELWDQGYVVVDSREALSLLLLWADTIFVGRGGVVRRVEQFQA